MRASLIAAEARTVAAVCVLAHDIANAVAAVAGRYNGVVRTCTAIAAAAAAIATHLNCGRIK